MGTLKNSTIHDWNGGFQKEVIPCDTPRHYYLTPKQSRRICIAFAIGVIAFLGPIFYIIISDIIHCSTW